MCLPVAYWTPKMHKNPVGKRFIVASKKCVVKPLSKHITAIFKLFYQLINAYHEKSHFFSGIKSFWVIQNNEPVINSINKINKRSAAKTISTFDFSTLYTKIPHDKLINVLDSIIDFAFKGGQKEYVCINWKGEAFWDSNPDKSSIYFSKSQLKEAVKYLIENCYFTVGTILLQQIIGIPMGLDPAPFLANFFLYFYESGWLKTMRKTNNILARKFGNVFRFIDDLNAINDGGVFEQYHKDIYPAELELKKENIVNSHATFLDLEISIVNNRFETKLYDKRDNFEFSIVRLPFISSNMPSKMFYSSLGAEFLRICRVTSNLEDVLVTSALLINRMIKQGANERRIKSTLDKVINKHHCIFQKYNAGNNEIIRMILQKYFEQ